MEKDIFLKVAKAIWREIEDDPSDAKACEDLLTACKQYGGEETREYIRKLLDGLVREIPKDPGRLFPIYKGALLYDAPFCFDSYLQYLEINRPAKDRFYLPRRKTLKVLVDAMQKLADDELDELFLSMPPRVGKSTVLLFYATWVIGRNSESSNLYSAFSDIITKAFYNGVLEVINDPVTYTWREIFPSCKVASTNSAEETLNIDRKKRYPSLTCRSLYGTLNGACDCNGILISDDLIGGIEEALNQDRLIASWAKVDNNLIPRAKEKAKLLWCGTRWSVIDPAGIRMSLLETDERFAGRRYQIINIPALNENDESNFEYLYGVGFSADYYKQRRASFERNNDMASWTAQYMGQPIEREGALFLPEGFRYYNGTLPEGEPDRVFMAVDPAFGGGDFVAAPICYQYGMDIYVHDVVYDNNDKKITQPLLAKAIQEYGIKSVRVEANKSTEAYKEGIEQILKEKSIRINMETKAAPNSVSKNQRIFDKAPDIREMMVFRESGKRSKPYDLFMQNVFSFKMVGKNKHDDAPDSLAMAIDMVVSPSRKPSVFKRIV